jgi:hypothetical protein
VTTNPSINLTHLAKLELTAQHCTRQIARCLEPGMTEETVASLMRQWLHQHGCNDAMHRPLAWFGDRLSVISRPPRPSLSRLRPPHFPSSSRLEKGQPFALYCAPRLGELVAESLHCGSMGPSTDYQQLLSRAAHIEALLLRAINQSHTLAELTDLVRQLAQLQDLQLCQNGLGGDWIRSYSPVPDLGQHHKGLMEKVVEFTGNHAPAHLPKATLPAPQDAPLAHGLWIVQLWFTPPFGEAGSQAAGMRRLLYITPQSKACWLNLTQTRTQAA